MLGRMAKNLSCWLSALGKRFLRGIRSLFGQAQGLPLQIRMLLIPFSWLYAVGVWVRNTLYARGVFKARVLPCTVISVGNIVVGGTGKTPTVIAIAKQLQKAGVRVAILLRGYKRRSREQVTIVSDGEKLCCSPVESGDEAHMIARHLSGIPVIVGRQRYLAGKVALKRFNVEVLLLDDGFQHRQLARNVEILTVNATQPYGTGRLLPIGTLREPCTALQRADIILLTHTDYTAHTARKDEKLHQKPPTTSTENCQTYQAFSLLRKERRKALKQLAPNALILESVHQPTHLYRLEAEDFYPPRGVKYQHGEKVGGSSQELQSPQSGEYNDSRILPQSHNTPVYRGNMPLALLTGKRLLAVCGIANPGAFVTTLMQYCPETVELLAFPDHHVYTQADLRQMQRALQEVGAELVVTTQKDEQKLASFAAHLPIVVLAIALVITEGNDLSLYLAEYYPFCCSSKSIGNLVGEP